MDALFRQANKLKETVAKQQQAVLKTFTGSQAPTPSDTIVTDEEELKRHKQLESLYASTKSAKSLQREIVKAVEGTINNGLKQMDTTAKLCDACKKYAGESSNSNKYDNNGENRNPLATTCVLIASSHSAVEKERNILHRSMGMQVGEPLVSMVNSPALEDARSLTQKYDKMRQEAETLVQDIGRRMQRLRDGERGAAADPSALAGKIEGAEQRLSSLSSSLTVLGKEANAAMRAVEEQQRRQTVQRMIAMVEAEKEFHKKSFDILERLHSQLISERQGGESERFGNSESENASSAPPPSYEDANSQNDGPTKKDWYFLAEVIFTFEGEGPGEMSLTEGDYVVVRKVMSNGWSEGECKGRAGWFPSDFVEKRDRVPAKKLLETRRGR